ncbi:hypothetical protein BSKO_04872 [Bryopsis sp. KO-2023]|nr:hypothetical protein BSKO_04872 [Bryopsis sp. KO-2023]
MQLSCSTSTHKCLNGSALNCGRSIPHPPGRRATIVTAARKVKRSQLLKGTVAGGLVVGLQDGLAGASNAETAEGLIQTGISRAIPDNFSKVQLRVWEDSELAVSIYPHFTYNARGAGGFGTAEDLGNGKAKVSFDPKGFDIPPLDYRSTKILGLPIPPPLRISIDMQELEGVVDMESGEANINFLSKFYFTAGSLYSAKPLVVQANLSTGKTDGVIFKAAGQALRNGRGRLVGIARVPKTEDAFLDSFLMLPTDCLAILSAELVFS